MSTLEELSLNNQLYLNEQISEGIDSSQTTSVSPSLSSTSSGSSTGVSSQTTPSQITDWPLNSNLSQEGGTIFSIKTSFTSTDAGYRLGFDTDNICKFLIGNATNSLYWNGTTLAVSGTITATSGTIGGFTLGATTLTATNLILDSANQRISLGSGNDIIILDADDTTYRMWIGNTTSTSAPFSVTKEGAIASTLGTIGGWTIWANSLTDTAWVVWMSNAVTVWDDIRFWAGDATPASAEFRVYESGALVASSATITGSITATSGAIGGWTINTTSITDASGAVGMSSAVTGGDDIRFWAGDSTPANAEFSVTEAGVIKATSGTIGGCVLGATSIGSTTFVSWPLGSGWNISNTGTAEFQNVSVRGIIRTSVFEKSVISAVNGILLISSADVLDQDMSSDD